MKQGFSPPTYYDLVPKTYTSVRGVSDGKLLTESELCGDEAILQGEDQVMLLSTVQLASLQAVTFSGLITSLLLNLISHGAVMQNFPFRHWQFHFWTEITTPKIRSRITTELQKMLNRQVDSDNNVSSGISIYHFTSINIC